MTHENIWRAIEKFARNHKMSCSRLAKNSGLDPTTFNKSKRWSKEGQPRWPSTLSIAKILSFTGTNIKDFAKLVHTTEKNSKHMKSTKSINSIDG